MIQQAFSPKYWTVDRRLAVSDTGAVTIAQTGGYTQIEHNFSLFFGLAVQAYERTLISDRTRFDRDRLTDAEARGRDVFTGKGQCVACHSGPLFSNATVFDGHEHEDVERMVMGDGGVALYDTGFYNIGVTPTDADRGVGGSDPFGNPLSFSRQFISRLQNQPVPDSFNVDPCGFDVPFGDPCDVLPSPAAAAQERVAVEGAFKTPSLRNIALTPPYMHNGSLATLEQVVDFYDRGGNARSVADTCDTTGFKQANTDAERCSNLDADIKVLDLSDGEKADLVAFLKALTDERVACHAAPFDHPALPLPVGHGAGAATTIQSGYASSTAIVGKSSGRTRAVALTKSARGGGISRITAVSDLAIDQVAVLPATGAGGYSASPTNKPCFPSTGDLFGETQAVLNRILR
jgi:hypothetical protein